MKDVQATEEASRERPALQDNTVLIQYNSSFVLLFIGHFVHLDPNLDPAKQKSMRLWIPNTAIFQKLRRYQYTVLPNQQTWR